eukprot:Lithocolla_globosa_v1_NODE_3298_length_1707_cov_5.375303.p2 type:complete len:102 gc:universal NODE_3298_length_1707_cov_5.375303:825-1130(+)
MAWGSPAYSPRSTASPRVNRSLSCVTVVEAPERRNSPSVCMLLRSRYDRIRSMMSGMVPLPSSRRAAPKSRPSVGRASPSWCACLSFFFPLNRPISPFLDL